MRSAAAVQKVRPAALSGERQAPRVGLARDGRIVLLHPVTTYQGLCDAMFQMIRQSGSGSAFVLIRLLDVLTKVAEVERACDRLEELGRQAALAAA
jgi:uncharacterized membrane protein